jgi:HEAT repeat protein
VFGAALLIGSMISPIFASSDILLKNNTRITGDIVSENENFISVNIDGSRVNVSKAMVRSINGQAYVPAALPQKSPQTAAAPSVPPSNAQAPSPEVKEPAQAPRQASPAPAQPPAPASPVIPAVQPVSVPSAPPSSTQAQKPASPAPAAVQTPARPEKSAWDETDGFGAVESENVKKLIEKLRSPFAFQRMRAALVLSHAGSDVTPAIPWLVRLLSDTSSFDPKLEKDSVITRYLQAPASINRIAAKTLIRIGKPTIKPLVNALDNENESIRLQVIDIISAIAPGMALKPLVQTLRDTSMAIREKTVEALATTQDAQALLPYLKDKNAEVRKGVVDIMARRKDPKLVEPLIHLLADRDSYVREKAAFALGELHDTAAVQPLIAALSDDISFVRRNAAEALGAIGDTRALQDLSLAKKDESDYVAATAAAALNRLLDIEFVKHDRDIGSLVDALKHENPDIRQKAANTLWVRTGRNFGVDYAAWKAWLQKQDSTQTPPVDTIRAPARDTAAAKGHR